MGQEIKSVPIRSPPRNAALTAREAISQAVTASEITASGNLHRFTFDPLTNAKGRADSLSSTAQPEADLWKATRPSGVGK